MSWYNQYCFEVTVLQILIESLLFKYCSDILFPANSYSFYQIGLKLCGQLDHEVVQGLYFELELSLFFKDFSDMTWFQDNSSYCSFYWMQLRKLGGQKDGTVHIVMRLQFTNFGSHYSLKIVHIWLYIRLIPPTVFIRLFGSYSTPNFDRELFLFEDSLHMTSIFGQLLLQFSSIKLKVIW